MTAAVKAVLQQAMQLTPEERAEVANALDGMSADAPALSPAQPSSIVDVSTSAGAFHFDAARWARNSGGRAT
jgi:hypothetical protein